MNKGKPMKYVFLLLLIGCCFCSPETDSTKVDSLCIERGHIILNGGITLLGVYSEYLDLGDKTIRIYYDPNYITGTCARCWKYVQERVQVNLDTIIIWRNK